MKKQITEVGCIRNQCIIIRYRIAIQAGSSDIFGSVIRLIDVAAAQESSCAQHI